MVRLKEKGLPIQGTCPARQARVKDRNRIVHRPRRSRRSSAEMPSQQHRLSKYHRIHQGVCHRVCPSATAMV